MRRLAAIFTAVPLLACGAHLHRPLDQQLAQGAVERIDGLDWDEAFAQDRAQREALAEREAAISRAYADARREAELLDILTEPIGERSWAKLEDRFIALAACMLDETGTGGGRACRGRVSEAEREAARSLLFDACPAEGCAWVDAVLELSAASSVLADRLAAYDRARAHAGVGDAIATAAQCPLPTRLPARLRAEGQALEQACAAYDAGLAAVAEALPSTSGLGSTINDYRTLAKSRDDYRRELRLLVADLGSLRFGGRFDRRELDGQVAHYLELQARYVLALAGAKLGDFGDLALEGTVMLTREHRAAIVRTLAVLGATIGEITPSERAPEDQPVTEDFRSAPSTAPERPREPVEPTPPRPVPVPPTPPRPAPDSSPPPRASSPDPSTIETESRRADASIDAEMMRSLGSTLAPVFGETWTRLEQQRRANQRGGLLLSAEIERIQLDAMTRRLAHAEERVWLELALIETQLLALVRLRSVLDADWIPADRPPTPERDELARLGLERELAEAALTSAQARLDDAIAKPTGKGDRERIATAKQRVAEAQTALDRAADAHHEQLRLHGAALCVRRGGVGPSYEREPACVGPIERLVGLHAELVGVSLPRLEALDRAGARRKDESALRRDQAGLEIRITYIAASVAALQRFTAGGLEPRDVAAIIGAVVGIGLGAAITTGVYLP